MPKASSSSSAAECEAEQHYEAEGLVCTCILLTRLNLGVGHAIKSVVWFGNTLWYLKVGISIQQNMEVDNVILQNESAQQSEPQTKPLHEQVWQVLVDGVLCQLYVLRMLSCSTHHRKGQRIFRLCIMVTCRVGPTRSGRRGPVQSHCGIFALRFCIQQLDQSDNVNMPKDQ